MLNRSIDHQWILAALAVVGIAERASWNMFRPTAGASGEAMHVATAIGRGLGFADAYRVGQGPTAHLLPVTPGIAGIVYTVFGVSTPLAEFVLASWSIGLSIATYLALYKGFGYIGVPRWARIVGLALGCLLPTYLPQEAVDFRVWDGGLAAFLASLLMTQILRASQRKKLDRLEISGLALTSSLAFFVNPSAGVAGFACLFIFFCLRFSVREFTVFACLAAFGLAIMIVPWTLRNVEVLGSPVLLRSNAGLELAIANYPGAIDPQDPGGAFMARLRQIHPAVSDAAYTRMKDVGGEVTYSKQLQHQTAIWMMSHPAAVTKLAAVHVRQTLFPQEWQFTTFGSSQGGRARALIGQIMGALGLMGLALGLKRRACLWIYPAMYLAVLLAAGAMFQPVKRYTYLAYPLLVFSSTELLAFTSRRMRYRTAVAGSSADIA